MNKDRKICILKCKEKDLLHNLTVLCNYSARGMPNVPVVIGKGRYFYLPIADVDEIKGLDVKGKIITE